MNHLQFIVSAQKKHVCIILFSLTLVIIHLISSLAFAATTHKVSIPEAVEVTQESITLAEIAEIDGADPNYIQRMGNIVIGRAPLPGDSRRIDEGYVRLRLKQNGIDSSQINLHIPQTVTVTRAFVEIPKEKIEKIVLTYIYGRLPWEKDTVRVKSVHVSSKALLPEGEVTYSVIPPKAMDFLRTIALSVVFKVNGKLAKKVWATVKLEVLTEVVLTKRPLRRRQLITEDDIHLKTIDLTKAQSNVLTNPQEVLGKRTKRPIGGDVVLTSDHIELPPLVRRGDVVLIVAESNGLKITALGEVCKRGCQGDRIKVKNLDSKKAIYARIVDSSTVQVDF
ncbi:MAG: flagellar basal body P-ring formation chaperone FlgA [Thermodesulfobacteriota bacterium]|nr:flagellar basal body P-ring formation chaperone FlgA [Thermodesulfobacteriota bacterium]